MAVCLLDPAGFAYVFEFAVSEVVQQHVGCVVQAARAAHHRHALPHAACCLARRWRMRQVEVHIVGDGDVELAVAVVVHKGAAGAPLLAAARRAGLLGHFLEGSVAFVMVQAIFAVGGDVDVVVAVVVIIADAGSLPPTGGDEAGLGGDVGEGAVVVVVEEMAGGGGTLAGSGKRGSVDEEDVRPAIAVIVDDGDAAAGGFDDVALGLSTAVHVAHGYAGLRGDVDKPGWGWVLGGCGIDAGRFRGDRLLRDCGERDAEHCEEAEDRCERGQVLCLRRHFL